MDTNDSDEKEKTAKENIENSFLKALFKKMKSSTQKYKHKYKKNEMYKFFKESFQKYSILILTILIVYFMYVQYGLSRDTARRQLRAYLIPNTPELTVPQESLFVYIKEGRLPIKYTIRNNGQTPAYDVRDVINVRVLPRDCRPEAITDTVRNSYHPIYGANTEHKRIVHSGKDSFVDTYFFKNNGRLTFEAGIFNIYVWGRIEYTDTFRDFHWTEFCYEAVFDSLIKEFRAYSQCNKADRKEPYEPFFGFL